jgi:hypothetical protein
MGNRPFNVVVILFWLATMSWLVVAKILPAMRVGEAPNYSSIVASAPDEPPSCWAIRMHGRTIGWSAGKLVRRGDGMSEFYSRVYLGELPIAELAPGWLAGVLKPIVPDLSALDVDKRSRLAVDPLGRLAEFESRLRLGNIADAIKIQGDVDGSTLKMSVRSGDISATVNHSLPANALLGDELAPQARMPGLRVGQSWTVPLYSPFRSAHRPLEILQATVEREAQYPWAGKTANTRVIVYRGDAGSGLGGDEVRGRMWVRDDGLVLCQEVLIFASPLQFERLAPDDAAPIWRALGDEWREALPAEVARQLLARLNGAVEPQDAAGPAGPGQ